MRPQGGPLRLGSRGSEAKAICVFVQGGGQSPGAIRSPVLARLAVPDAVIAMLGAILTDLSAGHDPRMGAAR